MNDLFGPRRWAASGPHDGTPPWSVGVLGIGPILWVSTEDEAKRHADSLNSFEAYVQRERWTRTVPRVRRERRNIYGEILSDSSGTTEEE